MSFNWNNLEEKIKKSKEFILHEIAGLRIDGANQTMLDSVVVEAYGSKLKINEVAQISTQGSNLIIVSPFDANIIADVEKAIGTSNLNLNPVVDGKVIKINIPPLTQERRQDLIKLLHKKIEEAKIQIRGLRSHFKKEIENQENISEDVVENELKQLEENIKKANQELDDILKQKEETLSRI